MRRNQKTQKGGSPNFNGDARQIDVCKVNKRPVQMQIANHNPVIL